MPTDAFELLKTWCDSLLTCQISGTGQPALDGALLCPACQTIHGRCGELVYPLLALARRTGESRYRTAALRLFAWSESLLAADGAMVNDGQSGWKGITVFAALALCDALRRHGDLLEATDQARWRDRLRRHGDWISRHIDTRFAGNINYRAAGAGVLALLANFFDVPDYMAKARRLAADVQSHTGADGLLFGEGDPVDGLSPRGCRPVDIGYNVEESLPLMLLYAEESGDREAEAWVTAALHRHLDFQLPDGGWDDSFGTRNYKWTYWGSRTSEGCLEAYALLGRRDPACAAAAARNLELMRRCTHDGLLTGGPDYPRVGAPACIHHSFTHARGLAALLDRGLELPDAPATRVPAGPALQHYPTIDTWRVQYGGWVADVTGYDVTYRPGGHATGGTLTLLWHRTAGPMALSAMTDYALVEAHNMQQMPALACQGSLTPRLLAADGAASCYDRCAVLHAEENGDGVAVEAEGRLCYPDGRAVPDGHYRLSYHFTDGLLRLTAEGGAYSPLWLVLPLARAAVYPVPAGEKPVFSLAGGLLAQEYRWPLRSGETLTVEVRPAPLAGVCPAEV